MKVEFENSQKKRRVIGEATNKKEAWKIINDFLKDHNYKSYYQRVSPYPDKHYVWMDVGSHSEFFVLTDMTEEEMNEWRILT